nr:MAG TPA: FMRP KH0 domain [Caudoviricetes sp.]
MVIVEVLKLHQMSMMFFRSLPQKMLLELNRLMCIRYI